MSYIIYDRASKMFVCKRKNVSYPLFCESLLEARFYKSYQAASTFAKQISQVRGINSLSVIIPPSYYAENI